MYLFVLFFLCFFFFSSRRRHTRSLRDWSSDVCSSDLSRRSEMFGETQRPTTERREACPQNHSVVRVLRGFDDFLLHATRGLIQHQEDKPVPERLFVQPQTGIAVPIRFRSRGIRALGAFEFAVQRAAPLSERVVGRLGFALVFVKTGATLPSKHLSVAQPEKDGRNVIAAAVS